MELKKNPKVDLNRKSTFVFQAALLLLLFFAWLVIEKTGHYSSLSIAPSSKELHFLDEETVPVTIIQKELPVPPAPKFIDKITLIKDDSGEEELKHELQKNLNTPEVKTDDIVFVENPVPIEDVLIKFIEEVPVFPGCENEIDNKGRLACMTEKIKQFINSKFDKDLGSELGLSGINTIYVSFKIDMNGNIVEVKSKSRYPSLEKEATRVVNSLPSMIPGKQQGTPVGVLYSLPIVFEIQ